MAWFCRVEKPQAPSNKGKGAVFTSPEGAALFQPTLCIWLCVCFCRVEKPKAPSTKGNPLTFPLTAHDHTK
jgi:hypothetical protein